MIALPLHSMWHLTNQYEPLSEVEVPNKLSKKNLVISKGSFHIFKGDGIEKFVQMTVKGLNIYFYDFGIAYPDKGKIYPIFLYQIISAPKRVLVVVNYGFHEIDRVDKIVGFNILLDADREYSNMLIKTFQSQDFLVQDVIPNTFNGLIRTTEIDKAYERVFDLFDKWYQGLKLNVTVDTKEEAIYNQWLYNFKRKFYKEDYGFTATKKFLGETWSREVFENYLFY